MSQESTLSSIHAERTVIGAILIDNRAFHEASQDLTSRDFYLASHRTIFACISRLLLRGSSADSTTVPEELRSTRELDTVGGIAFVLNLEDGIPRNFSVTSYVRIIKEKASLRQICELAQSLATEAEEPGANSEDLLDRSESGLLEIRSGRDSSLSSETGQELAALLVRMRQEKDRPTDLLGLPSGIRGLDLMTRGYQPGEITIVGAKSGVGKTSLLIQSAIANVSQGVPVLIFSLEMTRHQILRRILSVVSGVPFPRVRDTKWANEPDMQAFNRAAAKVETWPLHIIDAAGTTIEKITATSRLAIKRHGVKLIGIDYIQIVNAPGKDERLRVASISRALTRLAKDEQVPVIVLSQLSRPDRTSANRPPTMSDLRESSQLENDAHCIVLAHREWDEGIGKLKADGSLIIAKQRSGETGAFPVIYDRRTLTFADEGAADQQMVRAS